MSKRDRAQTTATDKACNKASLIAAAVLVLIALVSATVLSAHFSSTEAYAHQYEVLEAKRDSVAVMTTASLAASAALSAVPDDTFTPIASQLAKLSKGFAIVLGAIQLQEWLLTTFGFLFFGVFAPACCVALAIAALMPKTSGARIAVQSGALRVLLAVAVLWASIPCSVFLIDKIEETHAASVQSAIDAAAQVESLSAMNDDAESEGMGERIADFVYGLCHPAETLNNAAEKASELLDCANAALGALFEGFAVMVATTCVIPVLTPALSLWLLRLALSPAFSWMQCKQ